MLDSNTRATIASQLNANSGARSLIQASMAWMDLLYDSEQQLLRHPVNNDQHMVRESLWYALGLVLQSRGLGDSSASLDRVKDIVARVLDNQYDAPGKVWHGTFRVTQQEVTPPDDAVIWQDYDPNWRQFIGTVLLLLRQLEGALTL